MQKELDFDVYTAHEFVLIILDNEDFIQETDKKM